MLAFYDYPVVHMAACKDDKPDRVGPLAIVRLRTARTRGCVSRDSILSMVFKLTWSAGKRWRKLRGFKELEAVVQGIGFKDGIRVKEDNDQEAA